MVLVVALALAGCSKPAKPLRPAPTVEVTARTSLVGGWQDVGGKGLRLTFRWDKTWDAEGRGAFGGLFQMMDLTGMSEPHGVYEYREPKLILSTKHRLTGQYSERVFECAFDHDYLTLTSEKGKTIRLRKIGPPPKPSIP